MYLYFTINLLFKFNKNNNNKKKIDIIKHTYPAVDEEYR